MTYVKLFFTFAFILGLFALMNYQFIHNHESAHIQIAVYHGCQNYSQTLNVSLGSPFGHGLFKCYHYANVTDEVKQDELNLHSLNEVVGYHLRAAMNALYFLALATIALINNK